MIGVYEVYGFCFLALGIVFMMSTEKKTTVRRSRSHGCVKNRVTYDKRVKRHGESGERYW